MRLALLLMIVGACGRSTDCPSDEVLRAVHDAAFHLEHGGDAAADLARLVGPMDATTRRLRDRLTAASGDVRLVTEEVRAELSDWRCLTEEKHARFHAALPDVR